MRFAPLTLVLMAALALGACDDDGPMEPANPAFGSARAGSPALGVLTWNIYVGADLTQLLFVQDPMDVPCAVNNVWNDVLGTDFGERAVAIADQIEAYRPHIIGLNEVSTFIFNFGTQDNLFFLEVLLGELGSRGLDYAVAEDPGGSGDQAVATNFEITLPIVYGDCPAEPNDLISYVENDVILVRGDVTVTGVDSGNFGQPLPLPVPGAPEPVLKYSGWASVDVMHKDLPYRVFATHLEPADTGPCATDDPGLLFVHIEQANELMDIVDDSPDPVVLTGDLNSDASGCTTPTYPNLIDAGFVDAWTIGPDRGLGYTANQADDLLNEASELFHRIDFVLYRDAFTTRTGRFQGSVKADLVGEAQADRTPSGLWPSDHAGVMAELSIAPGRGHAE